MTTEQVQANSTRRMWIVIGAAAVLGTLLFQFYAGPVVSLLGGILVPGLTRRQRVILIVLAVVFAAFTFLMLPAGGDTIGSETPPSGPSTG